jgi:hypothetical protein
MILQKLKEDKVCAGKADAKGLMPNRQIIIPELEGVSL